MVVLKQNLSVALNFFKKNNDSKDWKNQHTIILKDINAMEYHFFPNNGYGHRHKNIDKLEEKIQQSHDYRVDSPL